MFVPWDPANEDRRLSCSALANASSTYREDYVAYYQSCAETGFASAPRLEPVGCRHSGARDLRVRQGQAGGAHHDGVLRQRDSRDGWRHRAGGPDARRRDCASAGATAEQAKEFTSFRNYVALPRTEAFRIEYWALEEAKLQRMPPEREFSRKIALIVGGGSGIGREVALTSRGAARTWSWRTRTSRALEPRGRRRRARRRPRRASRRAVDLTSRDSIAAALRATILAFGGVDIVDQHGGDLSDADRPPSESVWAKTLRHQRHEQLRAGAGGGAGSSRAQDLPAIDRVDQLGERGRAQGRQRALRREQGRRSTI